MKFKNPMLVVSDLERAKRFYREVLGLRVILDFGTNITLTGGLALQEQESWQAMIQKDASALCYGGNDAEIYFEEDDFDRFTARLEKLPGIDYVHPVYEHPWGQRAVRFYDPDRHIIEVGENIKDVCKRFLDSGLSAEETAERMDVPVKFVHSCLRVKG